MNKTLKLLPSLMLIIFIILSLIDRSDYALEKKLWRFQRQISELAQEGRIVPGKEYEDMADRCQDLIQKNPHSYLLPQMYMLMAEIDMLKKDVDKARANYALVLERFPQQLDICAKALMAIGETYLAQRKWDEAIQFYQTFIQKHPGYPLNNGLKIAIVYLQAAKK